MARLVKSFLGSEVSEDPSAQLSFQSIKKGLPESCVCMQHGMLDKLARSIGSPPRSLPRGYLQFVRREVSALFKKGWDASYESFCLTTTPPLSAVVGSSRREGGCLGALECGQDGFLDVVLEGNGEIERLEGELMVVQSAGKPRPLSKFEASGLALKPLHKTLYGFMKRFPWLLVGSPTKEKLRKAGFKRGGGVLVSGDYASATDGLSIEVAETILETCFSSAVFVPKNVQGGALKALRPLLFYGEETVDVTTGQMMGSYLSFPLLCLQNYLAFKWSLRGTGSGKVPLLINGDDILFQKDAHFSKWESSLQYVGLTVEVTKTSVEESWGTINSTLLQWEGEFLEPAWSARFGMFRPAEHPGSLGTSYSSFLSGCNVPDLRFRAAREFFKWHIAELRFAGVSPSSLGFRGCLARRMSGIFGLLELPLVDLPRPFKRHEVGYDADFVSRHDLHALGPEELFQSSLELGAQKWNRGYEKGDETRSAILYCISMASVKDYRHDNPSLPRWLWGNSSEFSFGKRNMSRFHKCKKVGSKPFLLPFPPRDDVLVSSDVLWQLGAWYEDGSLPAYSESPLEHFR